MTNAVPPQGANLRGAVDLSGLVNRREQPAAPPPGEAVPVPSLVVEADDQSFGGLLELSRTVPVVVVLRAEWSEQSTELAALLERLVREQGGRMLLASVDAERSPQLTQAFQAQSVPTVAAVIAGQPVQLFAGAQPEEVVRQVLDQLLQLAAQNGVTGAVRVDGEQPAAEPAEPVEAPLPPRHQAAYDAIERGDYAAAIAEYRQALAENPRDELASAGLAQVSLLHRLQGATADELRAAAAAAPADVEAQLGVADLDVSGGHLTDAFDRLLELFPRLDQPGRDRVRERLLEYFEIAGAEDPRVVAARRRLTNLLF